MSESIGQNIFYEIEPEWDVLNPDSISTSPPEIDTTGPSRGGTHCCSAPQSDCN